MNVLALTIGDSHVASTQYRLGQFAGTLRELGIHLDFAPAHDRSRWPRLESYDLVIVQKRLMRLSWVKRVRRESKRLIFDTDDAIWEPHGRKHSWWSRVRTRARLRAIVRAADLCTVANEHLAGFLKSDARGVEVVPMALDEATWHPAAARASGPLRIGWAGAPPNLVYLARLGPALHEIQRSRPEVEIVVYCGQPPQWRSPVVSRHVPFEPGTEADVVRTFDIGLLPLPDDAFAAGKSPIKALQYAACGVPCVASPVGATCEIVKDEATGLTAETKSQWKEALLRLIDDEALRRRLGEEARAMFQRTHTGQRVREKLAACWKSVTDSAVRE